MNLIAKEDAAARPFFRSAQDIVFDRWCELSVAAWRSANPGVESWFDFPGSAWHGEGL